MWQEKTTYQKGGFIEESTRPFGNSLPHLTEIYLWQMPQVTKISAGA
jgi:hypothetical protein